MWPPTSRPLRLADETMTAAFQRMSRADPALDLLVAGEPRLALGRDGVDVVGAAQRGHADLLLAGALEQPQHHVAGALAAALVDQLVEGVEPLLGLVGVDVGELGGQSLVDDRGHAVVRWLARRCRRRSLGHPLIVAADVCTSATFIVSRAEHGPGDVLPTRRSAPRPAAHGLRRGHKSAGLLPTEPRRPPCGADARQLEESVSATAGGGSTQTDALAGPAERLGLQARHGRPGARLGQRHRRRRCGSRSRTPSTPTWSTATTATSSTPCVLWWRDEDGDLVDGLVDSLTDLVGGGAIWLLTPKVGRPNAVDPADIAEAAPIAGLSPRPPPRR